MSQSMASRIVLSPMYVSTRCMRPGAPSAASRAVTQITQCRRASAVASADHAVDLSPPVEVSAPVLPADSKRLRYHVSRTQSKNLPVYHDIKSGGNRKLTLVRKIAGDVGALRWELQHALKLKDDRISINSLTKHIVIKGWHKLDVIKYLESKNL